MRHASLLHALITAGLSTGLFLGSSLISDATAATAGRVLAVSVDDFNYIDTSNEPTDQAAAHEKRLRAFMTALRDDVTADRRFELVPSSCTSNCPAEGPALGDRLRVASQAGAQIVISDESDDLRWWPADALPPGTDHALAYLVAQATRRTSSGSRRRE